MILHSPRSRSTIVATADFASETGERERPLKIFARDGLLRHQRTGLRYLWGGTYSLRVGTPPTARTQSKESLPLWLFHFLEYFTVSLSTLSFYKTWCWPILVRQFEFAGWKVSKAVKDLKLINSNKMKPVICIVFLSVIFASVVSGTLNYFIYSSVTNQFLK